LTRGYKNARYFLNRALLLQERAQALSPQQSNGARRSPSRLDFLGLQEKAD
jgi:hypothetical protein